MSFSSQNIKNAFPLWSKIRKDESSVGSIVIDPIGENLALQRINTRRQVAQMSPLSGEGVFEPGSLYLANLEESEDFTNYKDENIEVYNIEVVGTVNGQEVQVEGLTSYEEICNSYPTNSSLVLEPQQEDYLIEALTATRSSENTFELYKYPQNLYINVTESNVYYNEDDDRNIYNQPHIVIRGRNLFNQKIEETILINNDGLYKTKNKFLTIEPLERDIALNISGGKSIEAYGFDGDVEILRYPIGIEKKAYQELTLVKKSDDLAFNSSLVENFLEANLKKEANKSFFEYVFNVYETSKEYLISNTGADKETFEQVLVKQELLNDNLENVDVEDYCIDRKRNRLLCITSSGELLWYKMEPNKFTKQEFPRTKNICIGIESEKQRYVLGETADLFFNLENATGHIHKVLIGKQKPSDILYREEIFEMEWLQEDLSWGSAFYFFDSTKNVDLYEKFESIKVELPIDEYGQHNFYAFTFKNNFDSRIDYQNIQEETFKTAILKHILDRDQKEIHIDRYSINCEYLVPERTISLDIETQLISLNETPEDFFYGIWIEGVEEELYVVASNNTTTYKWKVAQSKDYFIFDYSNGDIGFLEKYDSVLIKINGEYEEVLNG